MFLLLASSSVRDPLREQALLDVGPFSSELKNQFDAVEHAATNKEAGAAFDIW